MAVDQEFGGKVALVTGAAMGIGAAVGGLLAERGAAVALLDRSRDELAAEASRLTGNGHKVFAIPADVTSATEVAAAIRHTVEIFGGIDIVSNNAGIQRYGTVETTGEDEWDEVLNVNLKSVYLVCRHAMQHLKVRRGAIVNMASVQSFATQTGVAAYTTSKHAILGLTKSIAMDFAKDGVRCNAVAPGSVDTPMLRSAVALSHHPDALMRAVHRMHPLGRIASPREVAEAVVFLASDRASFVTGSTLVVDGGLLLPIGGSPAEA